MAAWLDAGLRLALGLVPVLVLLVVLILLDSFKLLRLRVVVALIFVGGVAAWASLYANLARGFRAPQATELYRLQSGQQVADLESERLDSFEFGARFLHAGWSLDLAAFVSRKRDSVFRDAEGFNCRPVAPA